MKKMIFPVMLLLCGLQFAVAQLTYEKRIEFELRNGYGGETIYESSKGFFCLNRQPTNW